MIDKEILAGFREESLHILEELEGVTSILEEAEGDFPSAQLAEFAQKIDRIMGASQTLLEIEPGHAGLKRIATIARLCKQQGYKAAELRQALLVPLFAAFWADTLEALSELIRFVDDAERSQKLANAFASTVQNRLQWLGERMKKLDPAAVPAPELSQDEIDSILGN